MNNKISIIIPVYNCEKYLNKCLSSVKNQTYKNYEIIIINDGSTDNSLNIIKNFVKENSKCKYINQKNKGLSDARNNGMNISTGEYIFFLDSDDEIPNDAIENLLHCAIKNQSDIVIGNMINYNSKNKYNNYTSKYIKNLNLVSYKDYPKLFSFVHAAGKLYKSNLIKNIKFISNVKHEDNYFNYSLYLKNIKISMITNTVYYHRIRENGEKSITQSLDINSFKDLIINYDKVIEENKYDYLFVFMCMKKIRNYIVKYIDSNNARKAISISYEFSLKLINKSKDKKIIKMLENLYLIFVVITIKSVMQLKKRRV